jgi:hypothetical protein
VVILDYVESLRLEDLWRNGRPWTHLEIGTWPAADSGFFVKTEL